MQITKVNCPSDKISVKCPYTMVPQFVIVHNTANDASAMSEVSYMLGNSNTVSFHYAVDYERAVQGIEEDRNTWNCGDGTNGNGNRHGISIEICYSKSGGDRFTKSELNGAKLVANILKRYGWGIDKVKKHQDFNGKYCPHRTLDLGWERFLNLVREEIGEVQEEIVAPTNNNNYDIYKVCYNGTNIRKSASLSSAVAYQKNSGDEIHVIGSESDFYKLSDGNYIRMGYAYKVSTGVQNGSNYRVLYNGTNIRTRASLSSSVAYMKNAGDIVTVVGTENDFYKLSDGNYIRMGYANKTGTNSSETSSSSNKYRVNAEYPNIRAGASLNAKIVRLATKGEIIEVVGTENGFYRLSDGTYLKQEFADKI